MKQNIVSEVSDILDIFNLDEISKLLTNQITASDDNIGTNTMDHFKPLYFKYKQIIENNENTDDIKKSAEERFMNCCNIFLSLICKKFHLEIDDVWKSDHYEDLPGFTMALYSFFVMDLSSNIYDVCINYIQKNTTYIYEAFEDKKNKKDATTLVNKKLMPIETAVIFSNIYDVTTWILNQLSEEQFIEYMDPEYLPLNLIKGLFTDSILVGEFIDDINEIYASDVSLKGNVCFKIISNFRTSYINKEGE